MKKRIALLAALFTVLFAAPSAAEVEKFMRTSSGGLQPYFRLKFAPPAGWVQDDNATVAVEWNFPQATIDGLRERGHTVTVAPRFDTEFGCGQFALKIDGGYLAASDHRKDGYPVGL